MRNSGGLSEPEACLPKAIKYLTHLTLLCPEGATAQSPGLPLRLLWEINPQPYNRNAVATVYSLAALTQPRCG